MKNELDKRSLYMSGAEAAASLAVEKARSDLAEENRRRKIGLIKFGAMMLAASVVLVFATRSWFTMSREVEGTGANMTADDALFEIKVSGSEGLYDSYISRVDNKYSNDSQTSNSNQKLMWRLTSGGEGSETDGNMINLYSGEEPADIAEITKRDSSEYGLSPGDHGSLKFSIVPQTERSISVRINTEMRGFETEYYESGNNIGYQKDVFEEMSNSSGDQAVLDYLDNHISYYYMADEDDDDVPEMHLIKNGYFEIEDIDSEKEVTIYWAWAKNLSNIIDMNISGIDRNGAEELREEFFKSPGSFLEDPNELENFSSITISRDTDDVASAVSEKLAYLTSNTNKALYSRYKSMYNNADQTIGDKVGYIMFTMTADIKYD